MQTLEQKLFFSLRLSPQETVQLQVMLATLLIARTKPDKEQHKKRMAIWANQETERWQEAGLYYKPQALPLRDLLPLFRDQIPPIHFILPTKLVYYLLSQPYSNIQDICRIQSCIFYFHLFIFARKIYQLFLAQVLFLSETLQAMLLESIYLLRGILVSRTPVRWPFKFCLHHFKVSLAPNSKLFYMPPTNLFQRSRKSRDHMVMPYHSNDLTPGTNCIDYFYLCFFV